jgi:mono/diheme cytochrome c family protein
MRFTGPRAAAMLGLGLALARGLTPATAQDPAADDRAAIEALVAIGQPVFEANCSSCHGKLGSGYVGPSFVGNDRIGDSARALRQIRRGGADMPPFGGELTPEEIVAVGTFIRNSWGNAYGLLALEKAP